MNRPRIDENGALDIASVEALSREQLADWIDQRLHGDDLNVPSDPRDGDMPHYLLALIYPKLARPVREDVQNIVLTFLHDLARNPASAWLGPSGDELLLLIDPLLVQSPRSEEAIDLLLEMTRSDRFVDNPQSVLHLRALQGLVTFKHRETREFWYRQYQIGGSKVIPVVIQGLALLDISALLEWLAVITWDKSVENALVPLFPVLLEEYGSWKVERLVEQFLPSLPRKVARALRELSKQEGLSLKVLNEVEYFSPSISTELSKYVFDDEEISRARSAENSISDVAALSKSVWNEGVLRVLTEQIDSVSRASHPVLIVGTDRTVIGIVAYEIHFRSSQRRGPFNPLSCLQREPDDVEAALWGHPALRSKSSERGLVRSAIGGTLFVEDINKLPIEKVRPILRSLRLAKDPRPRLVLSVSRDSSCDAIREEFKFKAGFEIKLAPAEEDEIVQTVETLTMEARVNYHRAVDDARASRASRWDNLIIPRTSNRTPLSTQRPGKRKPGE